MEKPPEALLLLGPTGSGKTPLGELLETRGLCGRGCAHFDFGEHLRRAVRRGQPDDIVSLEDIRFLGHVLATGALLEERDFPIAERIVRSFLARCGGVSNIPTEQHRGPQGMVASSLHDATAARDRTLVILNGLPRHVSQAVSLARILDVRTVVLLRCAPETVLARVAANTGGDRTDRTDDDLPAIRRKIDLFTQRTSPLVAHFRNHGARMIEMDVTAEMTPESMWAALGRQLLGRTTRPASPPFG